MSRTATESRVAARWAPRRLKRLLAAPLAYGVLKPDKYEGSDGVPLVRIMDVEAGAVARDRLEVISPQQSDEFRRTVLRPGDVVVSVVGTLGRAFIATPELEGANLSRALARVQLQPSVSARFIEHWIASASFGEQMNSIVQGTAQKVLNLSDLREFVVALPRDETQTAIATFLDRKTAAIDALIAKKERLIELLQEKRQALITQAVTKGLDPSVPMKKSGIEFIGEIPAHWTTGELRRLAKRGTAITYGIVQAGPHIEDGIPYIKTSDMAGDSLPTSGYAKTSPDIDASYRRSKVEAGDVVVAIRATVGKALPVPPELEGANLTQGTAKVSPGPRISTRYLFHCLSSTPLQRRMDALAKGATFREITLDMLRRLAMPVPPREEQLRIADWVDANMEMNKAEQRATSVSIKLLREYRQSLITAAVTGKLEIPPEE